MAEHALHSHRSSLADLDYYNDTRSASAYSDDASSRYPSAYHSRAASTQEPGQYSVRKQPSLAQITVPSFSAFRSQTSSIPTASPDTARRKQLPFQAHTPRAHSLAELPSPRIVDPSVRPLSLDTGPHPPSGLSKVIQQASLGKTYSAEQGQRYDRSTHGIPDLLLTSTATHHTAIHIEHTRAMTP